MIFNGITETTLLYKEIWEKDFHNKSISLWFNNIVSPFPINLIETKIISPYYKPLLLCLQDRVYSLIWFTSDSSIFSQQTLKAST